MSRSVCVYHPRGFLCARPRQAAAFPGSERAARVVSSGHCTTKRAEREVLPGESEKRFAFFDIWACTIPCGRISALSGLLPASHLPQRGRQVSPSCRGVAGLFHVKHGPACLKLWAGKRALALSRLLVASHLPRRGRQVFPSCRGFAGLFHVKHGLACLKLWAGKSACPLRLAYGKPPLPEGEAIFRALPWAYRFVSRESRMACLKLWAGKRALALSGFPMANHLPQK